MPRKQSEEQIHRAIAEYCGAVLPESVFWTTFPAGGGGVIRGARLQGMGLKPGVPDLMFCYRSRAYFIEVKADGGKLSPAQRECHEDLFEAGACIATCRSIDDVRETFASWSFPTRDKAARAA